MTTGSPVDRSSSRVPCSRPHRNAASRLTRHRAPGGAIPEVDRPEVTGQDKLYQTSCNWTDQIRKISLIASLICHLLHVLILTEST